MAPAPLVDPPTMTGVTDMNSPPAQFPPLLPTHQSLRGEGLLLTVFELDVGHLYLWVFAGSIALMTVFGVLPKPVGFNEILLLSLDFLPEFLEHIPIAGLHRTSNTTLSEQCYFLK